MTSRQWIGGIVLADGKNHTVWPGFTLEFRNRTKNINLNDYNLEKISVKKEEAELV